MVGPISRWTIWFVALAVALAACGRGDDGTQEASPAPSAVASAPAADDAERSPSEGATAGERTYVVESGDTLSAIAQRFDTTVEAIVDANDIDDPDVIDVGDEFVIPGGR